jgi:toxin ParE1/3/4
VDYPRMGARRRDIWISTRILIEEPFLILYETIPDTDEGPIEAVEIVRVVHMRQDLTNVSR